MPGCSRKAKNETLIIPSLHFARLTSQEQGFRDFASLAVPLNTSRQDAPLSLRQHPNQSVPGNPSILVIFTLAIAAVFDTVKNRQEKCSADLALALRRINEDSQ